MFSFREYTIVGLGNSPTYLNYERGSTLGTGSVMAFAYIPYEGFDCDYYTDIYIRLDTEGEIYSDEYQAGVEQYEDSVTHSGESQARERFETLVGDAESELDDGVAEYDEGYTEYLEQRDEAERELLDARDEITAGRAEIIANEQVIRESEQQPSIDGRAQYDSGRRELNSAESDLESAEASTYAQLDETEAQLDAQLATAKDGMAQIEQSGVLEQYEQLTAAAAQLESGVAQLQAARDELNATGEQLRGRHCCGGTVHCRPDRRKAERPCRTGSAARRAGERDQRPRSRACHTAPRRRRADRRDQRPACRSASAAHRRAGRPCRRHCGLRNAHRRCPTYDARRAFHAGDGGPGQCLTGLTTERDNALSPLQSELAQVENAISDKRRNSPARPATDADRIAALQGEISVWKAARAN